MISVNLKSSRSGLHTLALMTAAFVWFAMPAVAQNKTTGTDLMPAMTSSNTKEYTAEGEETHPPIRISPDKTEMLKLEEAAGSIIVGNPAHLNVMLNNPRTLLLAPRQPGATQLTILNKQGKVIMQRHIIVSGPKEKYVRVRRTCTNAPGNCQPVSVYYCPGGLCSDVELLAGQATNYGNGGYVSSGQAANNNPSGDAETLEDEPPLMTNDEEGANAPDDNGDDSESDIDSSTLPQ